MPSAAPSAGASNGAASTSIAPHSVESIAKGPPRGGAAVAAPPSPLPCSSAVHASKRGADEQKPRRTLFWRSDAGRRTCETSEESGGSKAAPPSERAVVGLGAPVAPALAGWETDGTKLCEGWDLSHTGAALAFDYVHPVVC